MGGKFNSGFHQGLKAAEMAISILDGESVENIPIVKDDFIEYKFDCNQLKRYGIPFSKLPKGSIFINEPKSFFHLYKRRILAVCGIITGLLATIAILTMNIIRRRIIERELVQYQQRLKSLTSKLSLSEERERRRISNELYRSIGRSLVESKDKIRALCKLPLSSDIIDGLKEVSESLEQTIKNIKSLTFDLGTPILYESGLEAAISEWLLEQIEHKYGISTKFEGDGEPKPLDDDVRALVFRNVQELVINVVKHAQASRVRVYSQKIDNRIQIRIEDNGVGFNADEITSRPSRNGGFGLFNIRERLEQVGGRLAIESETGQGTRATITAPLNEGSSAK
jgi:signal transduction histidine kinase